MSGNTWLLWIQKLPRSGRGKSSRNSHHFGSVVAPPARKTAMKASSGVFGGFETLKPRESLPIYDGRAGRCSSKRAMSIGILITVHDGLVLAADSASALTLQMPGLPQRGPIPQLQGATINVYNNANKIANLYKGKPIGCVAYGSGSIGNASISTLLKDFRARMTDGHEDGFDINTYTMQDVADRLLKFLMKHVEQLPSNVPKTTLGILLGGYSANESLSEGWTVLIENGKPHSPALLRGKADIGINWGGEAEAIARLVFGFSQALPQVLSSVIKPPPTPQNLEQLLNLLRNTLTAPIVFAPMPIQDAIDLAEWLVHSAIMFSRFTPGPPIVGGPIEVAAITKHEGFKWIQRKHYYQQEFNQEYAR